MAYGFFKNLYGDADGYLAIWENTTKKTRWLSKEQRQKFELSDVNDLTGAKKNVYFGLGLQAQPRGESSRGNADGVVAIPGIWLDLDIGQEGHAAETYPPTVADGMALLSDLPEPTYVIHSGGGMHVYWIFDNPLIIDDDNRQWAKDLVAGVQNHVINKGAEKGYKVDKTADLARVLRLPGTFNYKTTTGKRVDWIRDYCNGDRKYNSDIFEKWIDTNIKNETKSNYSDADTFPKGERNTSLFKYGASRRAKGLSDSEIRAVMTIANQEKCDPPLSQSELNTTINSVLKYAAGITISLDDNFDDWTLDTTIQAVETANDKTSTNATANAVNTVNAQNKQQPKKVKTIALIPHDLTDLGNAKRFVQIAQNRCFYNIDSQEWIIWNGKQWKIDNQLKAQKISEKVIDLLKLETKTQKDPEIMECFAKWANTSQGIAHFKAIAELAKKDLPIENSKFDVDDMLLNCQNGIVDLNNGNLLPHDEKHLMSKITNANYDISAKCPIWQKFLNDVFEGNQEIIDFLQRWLGYNLTGKTSEKKFAVMTGEMNNGKSTMLNTMEKIIGNYAHTCAIESLLSLKDRSGSEANSDIANLAGVRYCITSEGKEGQKINDSLIKKLVGGGDAISARHLYQEQFTFVPKLKLSMMTNHVPRIDSADAAMWQRIVYIPFNRSFVGKDVDPQMPNKLLAEADGILSWMVAGCLEWQRQGLNVPEYLHQSTNALRSSCDPIDQWIYDNCVLDDTVDTPRNRLWQNFVDWACGTKNEDAQKMTNDKFTKMMHLKGHKTDKTTSGHVRYFTRIKLREYQAIEHQKDEGPWISM